MVVTSAPWLLTTAVLVSLRLAARSHQTDEFRLVEHTVTIIYAVTVVLGAPLQVVVSRYAADRLYDHHLEAIAAPLRRALAATLLGFTAAGIAVVAFMRLPLALAVPATVLTAVVGAQWLMLSVGSGLSAPGLVLRSFGFGAPLSVVAALAFERALHLGPAGYLAGFALGQLLTLVLLMVGVARALPDDADESARLWPALAEYKLLAASSFAYHLSIWADKLIMWLLAGGAAAALYTAASAVAWLFVIPGFSWIYVQIETVFYQRYRAFYGALSGGGTLSTLRDRALLVRTEALRILRGAGLVQGAVTVIGFVAAPHIMNLVGLPTVAVLLFRLALIGAAFQMTTVLAIVVLYYFDLRRDALALSLALLIGEVALTGLCWRVGLPPSLGYVLACVAACAMGIGLVRRRLTALLIDTFQSQPFGAA